MIDFDRRPVELDDQQRFDIAGIAGLDEIFGSMDRGPVHHLHAARDDAGADDGGDAIARRLVAGEADQQRPRRRRLAQDAHGDFGDDAEQALGAIHKSQQVIAIGIQMLAAEAHDRPVDQHHLQPQHIVGGDAVFQAMHAAGVLRHIAADGAGDLARGIGRVVEALALHRMGDRQVGHARLHHGAAVRVVDLEDAVELGEAQQDAVLQRQRSSGQRGAGAARHHLDALRAAIAKHLGDFSGGAGQRRQQRRLAVRGQAVAFIDPPLVLMVDDGLRRQQAAEVGGDGSAAADHGPVRFRHLHGPPP